MALPDKQVLFNEIDGLEKIPDHTLLNIATAGMIELLQGSPLNPSLPRQALVTASDPLQCLNQQEVWALLVRKLLDILELIFAGGVSFGGIQQFNTVADMQIHAGGWAMAICKNYFVEGDNVITMWVRIISPTIPPNGGDMLAASDGVTTLLRFFVREYFGA